MDWAWQLSIEPILIRRQVVVDRTTISFGLVLKDDRHILTPRVDSNREVFVLAIGISEVDIQISTFVLESMFG